MKAVRFLFNTIIPLVILAAGFMGMKTLIASRPAPKKEVRENPGTLVQVITVRRRDTPIRVSGTGTVRPHREVNITPQVSGRITAISPDFIAGGFFAAGDFMFEIERVDYELALEKAKAARAQAELELVRQQSNARVSRAEWERLTMEEKGEPNPLVLYEPQLKQARAALASADTAIRKAELDLERTKIFAPFSCRVRSEQAELGQYVRSGVSVGAVAGSDKAEIVVPLSLDEVRLLKIPRQSGGDQGSPVKVELTTGSSTHRWDGRVDRTLGEVDPRGRLTRVIVTVDDPYYLSSERPEEKPDLEVGLFVNVTAASGYLKRVFSVPRSALHDKGTVWIAEKEDTLGLRKVRVVRREEKTILIDDGLGDGDRVIVTSIEGAASGMKLRPFEEENGKVKGAVRWMARNHVAANLLMMTLVIGGVIKGLSVKQEVFPEVSLDKVRVSVAYPGAGPEEVEEGIIRRIEENLSGLDGIKEIKSTAGEGFGVVNAELLAGEDVDLIMPDIKTEVDRITTFPEDAEKPVITKLLNRREVISVVVYGDLPERTLREHAERVREDLLIMDGITQVDLGGVRPYEIAVEIKEENLRRYGLTLNGVARSLKQASLDLPGGTIKTEGGQILLRTKERRYLGTEYADIPLVTTPEGTQVLLGHIADVRDGFRETDEFARFDGKPAAMVRVYRVADQKPTAISREVIDYVRQKKSEFPSSLGIATLNDSTEIFQSRMNLLTRNAALGLTLVIIILGLFLEIRLALWVMLGLPISFFGALLLMPFIGVSINMISLFAFILALGIVVDDAIVVGESVYAQREKGKPYLQAAIDGALEVSVPVVYAILTTITAFLPLIFVSGMLGKFISNIPLVVIALLAVSLVESLFILPAHLAAGKHQERPGGLLGIIEFVRTRNDRLLFWFIRKPYKLFLGVCLKFRYTTVAAAVAILLIAIGIVRGGIIKFEFMPRVDGDQITASLKMPLGTPVEETARIQRLLVETGMKITAGYDDDRAGGDSILRNIYSVVGGTIAGGGPAGGEGATASHLSSVVMFLAKSEVRNIPASEIAERWRQEAGEIAGVDSLTFTSNLIRLGANIDIRAAHEDFAILDEATARIRESLSSYPGVGDLADSFARGKRELKIQLTDEARSLGISEEDLGRQVRGAFFGAEALRLQRGRNEVKVMVRYPESDRQSLADLESMRIRTPDGGEIPLLRAASIEEGSGFAEINRTDRKRVVNITASVDGKTANAQEILADLKAGILRELADDYPGISFDLEGEEKERREAMNSMKDGFLMAMVGIFALLAIPFRSYTQPLLIMIAIPFGVVGAVGGHLIMGYNLSMLSIFGIVALAGVVVNDSLLLIDQMNRLRRDNNMDSHQAVIEAGVRRFRPILLTSLTTFFGLSPMILEKSVQAKFLIPMAISLGFGILFATGITLLLIPALYLVLDDFHNLFGLRAWFAKKTEKAKG